MASHLTSEERDRIAQLWHQGADQKQIAEAIGRSPATISRELRRNGSGQEYYAGQAQQEAGRRRRERPLVRKLDDPEINEFVRDGRAREWAAGQFDRYDAVQELVCRFPHRAERPRSAPIRQSEAPVNLNRPVREIECLRFIDKTESRFAGTAIDFRGDEIGKDVVRFEAVRTSDLHKI